MGQIADIAFIRGRGEDLAMRFEDSAHACGGNPRVGDLARDILQTRAHFGKVGGNLNRDCMLFAGGDVVEMNLAELLIHDAAGTGTG